MDDNRKFYARDDRRCSYKCPFYLDGPVVSYCRKYGGNQHYDGQIPPIRVKECLAATVKEESNG